MAIAKRGAGSLDSVRAPIWKVTRWCCRSGMCVSCKLRGNLYGDMKRRARITHADKLTKASADFMCVNWREYDAKTELM